jgi:hypothetical protein
MVLLVGQHISLLDFPQRLLLREVQQLSQFFAKSINFLPQVMKDDEKFTQLAR